MGNFLDVYVDEERTEEGYILVVPPANVSQKRRDIPNLPDYNNEENSARTLTKERNWGYGISQTTFFNDGGVVVNDAQIESIIGKIVEVLVRSLVVDYINGMVQPAARTVLIGFMRNLQGVIVL